MTKTMLTAACALALGFAWSVAPAIAQDTTKDKMERTADRAERKAERAADKAEDTAERAKERAERAADRAEDRAKGRNETVGDKVERAWDKTKAKARAARDKVKETAARPGRDDVRNAQQALRDKGHDPGPVDGIMGPRTSGALREFQQKEGLTVTGQLDAETRGRLMGSASADRSPAASPAAPTSGQRQ